MQASVMDFCYIAEIARITSSRFSHDVTHSIQIHVHVYSIRLAYRIFDQNIDIYIKNRNKHCFCFFYMLQMILYFFFYSLLGPNISGLPNLISRVQEAVVKETSR